MGYFMRWYACIVCLILCPRISSTMTIVDNIISLVSRLNFARSEDSPRDTSNVLPEYDFIVVGAGTAGSVIANRLSEVGNWTILLLEEGGDENFLTDIPLMASYLASSTFNRGYRTEPSGEFCRAMDAGKCRIHTGRVLGGTSVINYMVYTRGLRGDFDAWKSENEGWGWEALRPLMERSLASSRLSVGDVPWRSPLAPAFLRAARQAGHRPLDATGFGFAYVEAALKDGARCSASKAFLRPVRLRRNLHVTKRATAFRVVIDKTQHRATGILFSRGGRQFQVRARREVILSAGAIGSPKLLMLSGVGPAEHLDDLGIPVVQDLRVGDNLQDHVALGGLTFPVKAPVTVIERRLALNLSMGFDYLLRGEGPLTLPGGAEVIGFFRVPKDTSNATQNLDISEENELPDAELVIGAGALSGDSGGSLRRSLGVRADYARRLLRATWNKDAWAVVPILLRPRSRGRLRLRSADPSALPRIFPNYLHHPEDVRVIVGAIKEAVKLSQMPALRSFGSELNPVPYPGCEDLPLGSDAYWECAVRQFTISMQHPVGTCKMGPRSDPEAIVDAQLRVHGLEGLRVADASIMPVIPAGHTMGPTYLIGEKAADLIKEQWMKESPSS